MTILVTYDCQRNRVFMVQVSFLLYYRYQTTNCLTKISMGSIPPAAIMTSYPSNWAYSALMDSFT